MLHQLVKFILAIVIAGTSCTALAALVIDEEVPGISLNTVDGSKTSISFQDKTTIVSFWRLEQKYSLQVLQELQQIYNESKANGVQVIAICSGSSKEKSVKKIIDENKLTFTILLDPDRKAYSDYGVFVSPATFIIDKEGKLRFYRPSYSANYLGETQLDIQLLTRKISKQQHAQQSTGSKRKLSKEDEAANAHYKLGLQLLKHGDRNAAEEQFRKVWTENATHVDSGVQLGFVLLEKKEYKEALEVFTKLCTLDPKLWSAKGGQAIAMIYTGKKAAGIVQLKKVLDVGASNTNLYYEMGRVFEEAGEQDKALESYKKGLKLSLSKN